MAQHLHEVVRQANEHYRAGRWPEARAAYDRALLESPDDPHATHYLGLLLHEQGDEQHGIDLLLRSIKLNPQAAEFYNNAATALGRIGRAKESLDLLEKALALEPDFVEAHVNRALALQSLGRWREAMESLSRATELDGESADAHYQMGRLRHFLGESAKAIAPLREAVRIRPDWVEAHFLLGELLLRAGDYESGWIEMEWGLKPQRQMLAARFAQPQWMGSSLSGKLLLLSADVDARTTIQLIRYVPLLVARGARVIVQCMPDLVPLIGNTVGVSQAIASDIPPPTFDLHVDLTALPILLGNEERSRSCGLPYIRTDRAAAAELRKQLDPGFRVGIAWKDPDNPSRSIPLHYFSALLACPNVQLIDLQTPPAIGDIADVSASIMIAEFHPPLGLREGGLAAVAEFICALDLIVSADTAVAHLAGALGVPVWVVLPPDADWRWPIRSEQTHWYPTMRLFHASRAGGWGAAFHQMAEHLLKTRKDWSGSEAF